MIPSNAAWVGAYGEQLPVRPLGQRRVAGREPPSERRLEGRPEYSGASRVHLHRHRAPITATQLTVTDIRLTVIQPMGTEPTHSPAMDIRATRDTPLTPVF